MSHTAITLYGTNWCSDCKRSKKFFGEQRVHYDFVDIDGDAEGLAVVEKETLRGTPQHSPQSPLSKSPKTQKPWRPRRGVSLCALCR